MGKMRGGAKRLMKMYPVRVCGYCPEVHVGPSGHKAQVCGAYKHQQRDGQHRTELRNFYGQAPAVVDLCIQAGAAMPELYKPTMRLDIGIPKDAKEAEMVV
ncbi:hypothetical protein ACH5RR_003580 [Cinchona calisaya]|uniref:APO domain-containing protein n=1 Tax=Cinchona calisaya TaxID=153742 RepID=A0ABD3AV98_9GENT